MKFPLAAAAYQTLFNDICAIYEKARERTARAVNPILVDAYHQIGRRLVTVEQKNKVRAEYGARVIQRLSDELTKKYPGESGFSTRNLAKMRQFYRAYPILPTSAKLDWSTYQVLSTIKDPAQRTEYERKAVKNGWHSRALTAAIKEGGVARQALPLMPAAAAQAQAKPQKLSAQCGELNLGKVIEVTDIHTRAVRLEIDVGFYRTLQIPPAQLTAQGLQPGHIVDVNDTKSGPAFTRRPTRPKGGAGGLASAKPIGEAGRYTYRALVEDVVDGDTLKIMIPFGTAGHLHPRLRLRGIDTPKLSEQKGREAKAFVAARLQETHFIIIRTHATDVHGRFVADVWYSAGERDVRKVMAGGTYLNQELLDNGLATRL